MKFNFGKKEGDPIALPPAGETRSPPASTSFVSPDVTDPQEIAEIQKISGKLLLGEKVKVVARQSRIKPGGAAITPNIFFATDRRLIIIDPHAWGLRETVRDIHYSSIIDAQVQKGVLSSNIVITISGANLNSFGRFASNMRGFQNIDQFANMGQPEQIAIEAIPKDKADRIVFCINAAIEETNKKGQGQQTQGPIFNEAPPIPPPANMTGGTIANTAAQGGQQQPSSFADEVVKLAKLKEQGLISNAEFQQMKEKLILQQSQTGQHDPQGTDSKMATTGQHATATTGTCEDCMRSVQFRKIDERGNLSTSGNWTKFDPVVDQRGRVIDYMLHVCRPLSPQEQQAYMAQLIQQRIMQGMMGMGFMQDQKGINDERK